MQSRRGVFHSIKDGRKVCARCRVEKPEDAFYPKKTGGRESYCLPCKLEKRRQTAAERANLPDLTAQARLDAKTDKNAPGGCWLFTSTAERKGYGSMVYKGKMESAHRIAWSLAGRPFTPGLVIDHTCMQAKCVNVDHMREVTPAVSAVENCEGVSAKNARKLTCSKGHRYSLENTAIRLPKRVKNRHGNWRKPTPARVCLTCFPDAWPNAIIERGPPPGRRVVAKWRGPAK